MRHEKKQKKKLHGLKVLTPPSRADNPSLISQMSKQKHGITLAKVWGK